MPVRGARPGLRAQTRRRGLLTGIVMLAAMLVGAACDSAGPVPPPSDPTGARTPSAPSQAATSARPLAWSEVTLPGNAQAVTLVTSQDHLVVATFARQRPHAGLLVLDDGQFSALPTQAHSAYAFEARWTGVAVHDGTLVAVAGARGGAHANYRWTVWRGTVGRPGDSGGATGGAAGKVAGGAVEQPQPFGVFGGWGAGDLTGVAFAGDVPVIAGAWASDRSGNDVSLWRVSGERWARQSSTGTPLGSTTSELKGGRAITSRGSGLALAGSVTDLAAGGVASVPALWTAPSADGPWTLLRLPATSKLAEAHAATCGGDRCLVVGQDGGQLAAWEVTNTSAERVPVPPIRVPDKVSLLAPVTVNGAETLALPGLILMRNATGWSSVAGPPDSPVSAAVLASTLYVVTQDAAGRTRMWSARP